MLDFFNFSPIGIPGSNPKALKLEHLVGITRLYIVRESDGPAGEAFVSMMAGRLKEIGYAGAVRVIVMPIETKDPRALYRDVGATKFHDAPCQSPPSSIVSIRLTYVRRAPRRLPPSDT